MRAGQICLSLGILLSGACAVDFNNPLPSINRQVTALVDPLLKAPAQVQQQIVGNVVERTFTDYYFGGHKYVTVATDNTTGEVLDCVLIGDREFIAYMIGDKTIEFSGPVQQLGIDSPDIQIINITTDRIDDFIMRCDDRDTNKTEPNFRNFLTNLKLGPKTILKYAAIFPGTKWCGAGDVARNYDDLGHFAETDKCCRDHDHAIENMARGETKYGLKNNLLYTMTRCDDDERFNECLYNASTVHAGAVGTTYFNILKTKCFDLRKQARCLSRTVSLITPCKEYAYDEDSPETWQIFDATKFSPNASLPAKAVNDILHSAPGLGDFLALF